MNCKRCGSPMNPGDQFCKTCGATVVGENMNMVGGTVGQPSPDGNTGYSNNMAYNNQVVQPQKKSNSTAIIIGVIIAIAVFAAIVTGFLLLGKDEEKENTKKTTNVVEKEDDDIKPTPTTSTYTVKFSGFTLKVPSDLVYQTQEDALALSDEEGTWVAGVFIAEGNYSQVVANKNKVKANFQVDGIELIDLKEETIGGVDYLLFEVKEGGESVLVGFTKATSTSMFAFQILDMNNEFNYDALEAIAPIFKNATYNGDSNNIEQSVIVDFDQILDGISE